MPYDERLAERIRAVLADRDDVVEKKMFGGLTFMVAGHMCCGVLRDELVVRLGADAGPEAADEPYARTLDFTGRPMPGLVMVEPDGVRTEAALRGWVDRGIAFVSTLPARD